MGPMKMDVRANHSDYLVARTDRACPNLTFVTALSTVQQVKTNLDVFTVRINDLDAANTTNSGAPKQIPASDGTRFVIRSVAAEFARVLEQLFQFAPGFGRFRRLSVF